MEGRRAGPGVELNSIRTNTLATFPGAHSGAGSFDQLCWDMSHSRVRVAPRAVWGNERGLGEKQSQKEWRSGSYNCVRIREKQKRERERVNDSVRKQI